MPAKSRPSQDEVLLEFGMEQAADHATLTLYLRKYPEYADGLIDLSRELNRTEEAADPATAAPLVDRAWARFSKGRRAGASVEVWPALSVEQSRQLASQLGVKRQVLLGLRSGKALRDSIPAPFTKRLADALHTSVEHLLASLAPARPLSLQFKADSAPGIQEPVTFEQLLIEAGHTEEERAALLSTKAL